ncbi:hypothetical protein IWX76_002735 [Pedobacter sp. CAN_A7]|uniref:hypothetical protein n=1 Tax=Pedobacter sp. CAN_A7 TaxID=2787722 RepID=UPI0018CA2E91
MKNVICAIFCCTILGLSSVKAQQNVYLSAHLSTQGPGLEVKYVPQPGFNLRAGASMLPLAFNTSYTVQSRPADAAVEVDVANAHFLVDWHPFIKSDSFSSKILLSTGVAYFWKSRGDAVVIYDGTFEFNDVEIPANEVGELYGSIQWNKFAPYVGLGFENPRPKKRVNVGFAIGTYYMGEPTVEVTGTKYLTDTESDEQELRENVSPYQFLPVVQVNLNFRL